MPKVAIITRTKDRPVFLARAIHSVASQTFTDYVQVIVNDGGDESSVEKIVQAAPASQKDRIKVFHRKESSNAPDTIFNESIDRIKSEYFVIHDDDDTWQKDFLEKTVAHLDEHPEQGAVVTRTDKVVEELRGKHLKTIKQSLWMPDLRVINLYRQCIDNQLTPIATLIRRSAYEKVGKFDSTLPVVGDWEFGIRLLKEFDAGFIDPGYSLAFYHHRAFKAGAQGNTSFAGNEKHRYYTNLVMNKYLRAELVEGRLGVGYIMSQLKYNHANTAALINRMLPGFIVRRLKKRVRT